MPKEEKIDEETQKLMAELAELESQSTGVGSTKKDDAHYKFLRDLMNKEVTTNIGNLSKEEVGQSRLSLRGCLHIARYAKAEGIVGLDDYFYGQADDITRTSLSKQGFQQNIFISTIKKEFTKGVKAVKKKWFGKPPEEEQ